jgi:hypothetical protein
MFKSIQSQNLKFKFWIVLSNGIGNTGPNFEVMSPQFKNIEIKSMNSFKNVNKKNICVSESTRNVKKIAFELA